jgi:hypothetical protein
MRTINDIRSKFKNPNAYVDPFANNAANEYAEFLLSNKDGNEETFKKILESNLVFGD